MSRRLRQAADSIWEAQHRHPFVLGIGDGTLDKERFKFWVRQDYLFLIDYARLLSLAAARSHDMETMARFADLAQSTLKVEMDLHRSYAAQFGISTVELEAETKAPTCQGYTDFLLRVAALGDWAELVAALLPCMWGYSEIGLALDRRGRPQDHGYAQWIEMYASPDFADLARWCRELVDRTARGLPRQVLARMESAFLTSSRYELLFWDMAYGMERWPA